jgi:hypothetical protein
MSAIGREGGHSRGARARASQTLNTTSNQSRSSSPAQSFNRPAASEQRVGAGAGVETGRSGSDRAYAASDRDRNRNEPSGDIPSSHSPYTGRDEI